MKHLRTPFVAAAHDIVMAALSLIVSFYLRLGDDFSFTYENFLIHLALFTALSALVFLSLRLYRGVWRYASIQDLLALTKAVTLAILLFLPLAFLITRLEGLPRSLPVIHWFVLMTLLGAPRFAYRITKDRSLDPELFDITLDQKIPVLLIGLDDKTELFIRNAVEKRGSNFRVVGIVSDEARYINTRVHNIKIYGPMDHMPKILEKLKRKRMSPQKLVVAESIRDPKQLTDLTDLCETHGLTIGRVPDIHQLKHNKTSTQNEIAPIMVEDLLNRPQIALDRARVEHFLTGKVVMVTGAGGSIGSELARQIARYEPKALILLEQNEHHLYSIDYELSAAHPELKLHSVLGSVLDAELVTYLLKSHKVFCIYHAAAIKHVPLSEVNAGHALETNLIGTKTVADCAIDAGVSHMVVISTDKAVEPTNVMGATKRMAELYIQSLGQSLGHSKKARKTCFSTVRFGNVLGSSGSVVPLFQSQIGKGGPVTITHPDITRYFMTIREAVELVLQASTLSSQQYNGGMFVLNMGDPIKIRDLAKQIIILSGLRPESDIAIEYTGLRAGEKMHEDLFYPFEKPLVDVHPGIWLAAPKELPQKSLDTAIKTLGKIARDPDSKSVRSTLLKQMNICNEVIDKKA